MMKEVIQTPFNINFLMKYIMKKIIFQNAKNGKVINEIAVATSKKALVKVDEMPEIITEKTDGWITDDLHLLIEVGCAIDNYKRIGDVTFYKEEEDGKVVGAMACIEIEVEAGIFGGQLIELEEDLNATVVVNCTGRESAYQLVFIKW